MTISIGGRIIGDLRIQTVALRPIVGAYELLFPLYLTVHAAEDQVRHGVIAGARVTVRAGTERKDLGFARPESRFDFMTGEHASSRTPILVLPLQPGQVSALEELRGTGDLDFELLATGVGVDEHGEQNIQASWQIHMPRSAWIKELSDAKARDVLLLEVPIPLRESTSAERRRDLKRAEESFRNGDYNACVAACRTVIQELGYLRFGDKEWAGPALDRLANDRRSMSQGEREAALWGALRHYTHQAHHGDSEGGVASYSRTQAQAVLILTAALASLVQEG